MIYFLIPVYNEEKNIPNLHRELNHLQVSDDVFYVFSDDGSHDKSKETIQNLFPDNKYIILGDGLNYGPGHAFNVGFEWLIKNAAPTDRIVTIEADTTSDLGILPAMLSINQLHYNLVLASVYAQGGGFEKTSLFRKIISFIGNIFMRFFLDIKVLTLSSFYRVYDVQLLIDIQKKYGKIIEEKGFTCMIEVLFKAISCQANIVEVPMRLKSTKREGKSKMKILKTIFGYLGLIIRLKRLKL